MYLKDEDKAEDGSVSVRTCESYIGALSARTCGAHSPCLPPCCAACVAHAASAPRLTLARSVACVVCADDNAKLQEAKMQLVMSACISFFVHMKWGYTQPLIMMSTLHATSAQRRIRTPPACS